MERLLRDEPEKYEACRAQLDEPRPGDPFSGREQAALRYVDLLTREPGSVGLEDVDRLRSAGL